MKRACIALILFLLTAIKKFGKPMVFGGGKSQIAKATEEPKGASKQKRNLHPASSAFGASSPLDASLGLRPKLPRSGHCLPQRRGQRRGAERFLNRKDPSPPRQVRRVQAPR
jgi:hypothetical protein